MVGFVQVVRYPPYVAFDGHGTLADRLAANRWSTSRGDEPSGAAPGYGVATAVPSRWRPSSNE